MLRVQAGSPVDQAQLLEKEDGRSVAILQNVPSIPEEVIYDR